MAATPPLQILSSPATPPSPLHGAKYDRASLLPPRRSARTATRTASRNVQTTPDPPRRSQRVEQAINTPSSPKPRPVASLHSPEVTPKRRGSRRVQIMSPPSPDIHFSLPSTTQPPAPSKSGSHLQPQSSSTATISHGMLPTPVKTPKKKTVSTATAAARALFQDPINMDANTAPVQPSPRRPRKNQRFNGFSLESFSAQNDKASGEQVQIYTDSRDRVPDLDTTRSNPFIVRKREREASPSQPAEASSKRRKANPGRRMDPQVEEAIKKDEGMVYVFRGKKVYRRFRDAGDEEEVIDAADMGLLEHTSNGTEVKPLKTLSRRSIKPTRLFQTEAQKRAREQEKEEEAATDIDEGVDEIAPTDATIASNSRSSQPQLARKLRSNNHPLSGSEDSGSDTQGSRPPPRGSPFDSWPRLKSSSRTSGSSQKGKRRAVPDIVEDHTSGGTRVEAKKIRA